MSGRRAHPLDRWVATLGTGGRALEPPCITQSRIGNPTAHRIACGTVSGLVGRRQGEAWSDLARRATRQPERRRGVRPVPTAESRDFRAPDSPETMSSPRGRSRSVAPPAPIRGSLSAPPRSATPGAVAALLGTRPTGVSECDCRSRRNRPRSEATSPYLSPALAKIDLGTN